MEGLQGLFDEAPPDAARVPMNEALTALYGGPLALREECVYSNFVSSLDGVVALPGSGVSAGPAISGRSPADRYVMGLLRAAADCVLVGAETLREDAGHVWTPGHVYPAAAEDFARVRSALGLAAQPRLVVLTRSGELDRSRAAFRHDPLVLTGERSLSAVLEELRGHGWRRVLCEGGPDLMGQLLRDSLLDDVFLTLSPVLAGRDAARRPGMVSGIELLPDHGVWGRLVSVKRHRSHLFLRYDLREFSPAAAPGPSTR